MIALSYSRLSDYRQCPHKFDMKYLRKEPEFQIDPKDKSVHLVRGENVHKGLENYVIRKRTGVDGIQPSTLPEVERTKPLIDGLMRIYDLHPEHKLCINEKFEPVDWFARDAYFRAILDIVGFGQDLFLGDYKTGKLHDYEGSMETPGQLHLSALTGMAVWPMLDTVRTVYIYVDHKVTIKHVFNRNEHFEPLKAKLIEEHERVNSDKDFKATPNRFCGYCEATRILCEHSKKP